MDESLFIWVPEFEGHYSITDEGRTVLSHKTCDIKAKSWSRHRQGYLMTNLTKPKLNGTRRQKLLLQHQAVWIWHNGPIPTGMSIDHINGIVTDNRIENLRLCSQRENTRNKSKQSRNTSGVVGVSWANHADKWKAQCADRNGKNTYLGYFQDIQVAAEVVKAFRLKEHGEFAIDLREPA